MIQVSVLIPTYERPVLLRSCLESLTAQDLPADQFEVVAVNDGSGEAVEAELRRAAERLPNLTAVNLPANGGPAAARNRAVRESSGPLLLFLDDDVVAAPTLLSRHLHHHAGGQATGAVLGRVEWHTDLEVTPFMRWLDTSGLQFAYETWLREGPVQPAYAAFYTANLSIRREIFLASGGFDERFPYAAYEDMELGWRLTDAGLRLDYRPDALAFHRRAITLSDFCRRMERVGASATQIAHVQPDFPVDDDVPLAGLRGWKGRALLSVAALAPRDEWREAHYRAEVAAAYLRGRTGRVATPVVRST